MRGGFAVGARRFVFDVCENVVVSSLLYVVLYTGHCLMGSGAASFLFSFEGRCTYIITR